MLKFILRPIRPLYRAAALGWLWGNRRDVARWANFARRAVSPSTRPNIGDLKLEGRVRASISTDPVLRGDPSLRDIRVHDGIVVLETPADWHNKGLALSRIGQVKGVETVHTATDVNEQNWLDVDLIEAAPVAHAGP